MMNRFLSTACAVILGAASGFAQATPKADTVKTGVRHFPAKRLAAALSDEQLRGTPIDAPLPHLAVAYKRKGADAKAFLFSTTDLGVSGKGLRDKPFEVFVLCDEAGRIISVIPGANTDTPAYVGKVSDAGFFKKWEGFEAGGKSPDAVTGATSTSRGVAEGVKALMEKLDKAAFFKK